MLMNRVEYVLMNNPVRALVQRRFEAARLLRMGGAMDGGAALELGCGQGVGAGLVLDRFGADSVDAFDLDPRMVTRAAKRLRPRGARVRLWVGDATALPVPDATYDAVFDFGIIHHIPRWWLAVREVSRVLKPGGRFYAEEVLTHFLEHAIVRWLLRHPEADRFDAEEFSRAMVDAGLVPRGREELGGGGFAWFVATKPTERVINVPASDLRATMHVDLEDNRKLMKD